MLDQEAVFDHQAKSALVDRLSIVLSVQLDPFGRSPIEGTKIEPRKGEINSKALGYIYGFIDSALQWREQDITDLSNGFPVLFHVIRKLFPGHEQCYIEFLMQHMNDELVVLGMMVGGQEYNEWMRDNRPPLGLARLILEGPPN